MIWVTEANALPEFRLRVRFSDGTDGEVELKEVIAADHRPIVAELCNPAAFAAIRVEMDTVVWANGFDLAPEFLYTKARAHSPA